MYLHLHFAERVRFRTDLKKNNQKDQQRIGSHSVKFQRGYKTYFGVRVQGAGGILQGRASHVRLFIPKELYAFVYGYIHVDPSLFLHEIPKSHCLVAPIVEYQYYVPNQCVTSKPFWFKIKVPHCITRKQDLQYVQVRHGDIHKGIRFTKLPSRNSFFLVDEKYITISTKQFSQFICTSCKNTCEGRGVALLFGKLTRWPGNPPLADLRLFLCSPLLHIRDYQEVRDWLCPLKDHNGGTHFCSASWFFDNVVNFCIHFDYYTLICKKLTS